MRGDAAAAILDSVDDPAILHLAAEAHAAPGGRVADGVGEEVAQQVDDARRVHPAGDGLTQGVEDHLDPLRQREETDACDRFGGARLQVEGAQVQGDAIRLVKAQLEQVAHPIVHVLGVGADPLGVAALALGERAAGLVQQELGGGDDGRERRAQTVRDRVEEAVRMRPGPRADAGAGRLVWLVARHVAPAYLPWTTGSLRGPWFGV
ncbi:hypothetical protein D3C86_1288580 [compost metagenome]